tara:strand:+ start:2859 stop:3842 length:984 start_codon:yes stop_codon:yes gene_type:complete
MNNLNQHIEPVIKIKLLEAMKRIREIELTIASKYSEQLMRCPVHLSVGQEAPSGALSLLIKKIDFSVSTHRGHAHYLAKGGDLNKMIAELYGKSGGCSQGKGGSMHLIDTDVNFMGTSAIVGNSIPTGTGLAMAAKLKGKNAISIIHIGDGAIEEGSFYESLNFSALHKIPALYLCENNFFSVYSPMNVRQPKDRSFTLLAKAIGLKSFSGDGNNPKESYKLLKEAIEFTRSNKLPSFVELKTYRWLEHCGPSNDDNLNYRDKDEVNYWKNKDPIKLLESELNKQEAKEYKDFCINLKKEINSAFDYAEASPPPSKDTIYKDIYSDI